MKEFKKGQKIKAVSGKEIEILDKLGEGGQGIVYKVKYDNQEFALKWYFGNKLHDKISFYKNIQDNIKYGAPTNSFLWPIEITEYFEESFGYIMKLRPQEYKDFSSFLLAKVKFSSIDAIINAALCIVNSFRALHTRGFSYQDLNDGNFFINPKNGDVLICDNDNVAPYGENLGIAGKCRYMAPEIVMGKKRPDIHTDRFSLAVILYLLLFLNHPLEGKQTMCPCLTEELERKFYGEEPVFVWDPNEQSNRPVRGVHINEIKLWAVYPKFIRDIFTEAFSKEVLIGNDIEHRIQEKKWQEVFTELRNITVKCSCGGETFIDILEPVSKCINCGNEIKRNFILKVKKYNLVLSPGKNLYSCHVIYDSDDFREKKGEVVESKLNNNILGIKNNSKMLWKAILPNGISKIYSEGQVIKLGKGLKIDFGNGNIGEII